MSPAEVWKKEAREKAREGRYWARRGEVLAACACLREAMKLREKARVWEQVFAETVWNVRVVLEGKR
jgi:hypothetical protein